MNLPQKYTDLLSLPISDRTIAFMMVTPLEREYVNNLSALQKLTDSRFCNDINNHSPEYETIYRPLLQRKIDALQLEVYNQAKLLGHG
nr:hypothetical protein [uncultured Flavobacterium sp.]